MVINSVGKKISLIILLAIVSTGFLMVVSFSFFGKIGQIGDIVKSAYQYEVFIGEAKFEFEKFSATGDTAHLDRFRGNLALITQRDGTIGELYRFMKQGMSPEDAVTEFRKNSVPKDSQFAAANLIKTLMGNPLLTDMVAVTDKGHGITTQWASLVETYAAESDDGKKQVIIADINAVLDRLPGLMTEFHAAMEAIASHLSGTIKKVFLIIGGIISLLLITIAVVISRSITRPLKLTVGHVHEIARGNFLNSLEIRNRDELGVMVGAMNEMSLRLKQMVRDIKLGIDTLNSSAGELYTFSDEMSENASSNADKANAVAAGAEKMSANMSQVSMGMETSSQNTNSVVTAVEEMTATINEIAKNTETAKQIAEDAVDKSEGAADQMARLDKVANAIGKVTETIRDISEQTDLLSLNATIEAARAGEAGKGFAVVAGEIKELSKQTSNATLDIQTQVDEIQETASASVAAIQGIAAICGEVNQIVQTIAAAIEEQSIATREIAENTTTVSDGILAASDKVGQSSAAAREISESIQQVHTASDEMNAASSQIKENAHGLTSLAERLGRQMEQFKV